MDMGTFRDAGQKKVREINILSFFIELRQTARCTHNLTFSIPLAVIAAKRISRKTRDKKQEAQRTTNSTEQ